MENLHKKIERLERQTIEYFLQNPNSSHVDYCRKIREQSTQLQQEIPINVGGVAMHNYLVGKILNICVEFDPKAEVSLDLACRMDPTNTDAWLELGTCVWKKPDLDKALMNFDEAVLRKRSPKALCLLSAAKRARLSSTNMTSRERMVLIQECIKLCNEALKLRPDYPFGWYSLGNTYIYRFFAVGQIQEKDLVFEMTFNVDCRWLANAIAQVENQDRNQPEVQGKLTQTKKAKECLVVNGLEYRKGNITQRRFKQIVKSMEQDRNTKNEVATLLPHLNLTQLKDLQLGENPGGVAMLKIVGVVPNDEEIPYSVVATDDLSSVVCITMYNFSKKFFLIIGDKLLVPKPLVLELKDFQLSSGTQMNLRLIRIVDPVGLVKNGRLLGKEYRAYTNLTIQTKLE